MEKIGYREYYTRRKQKSNGDGFNIDNWEEILSEDLWEDGELGAIDVSQKLFQRIVNTGEWKIIKEIK